MRLNVQAVLFVSLVRPEIMSFLGAVAAGLMDLAETPEPPAAHSTVTTVPLSCCCRCVMSSNRSNSFLLKEPDSNIFRSCKNSGWICRVILHIYGMSRSSSGHFNSRFNLKYEKV